MEVRRQPDRPPRTRRPATNTVTITHPSAGATSPDRSPGHLPTIFIADDQEDMLKTIAHAVMSKYQIVGLAANGKELLELVPVLKPDILVLDVFMPFVNGIEAAFRLRASGCPARVVFVTVHEDIDFVEAARAAGALGYVLKPRLATDLIPAIHSALTNGFFLSPCLQATH